MKKAIMLILVIGLILSMTPMGVIASDDTIENEVLIIEEPTETQELEIELIEEDAEIVLNADHDLGDYTVDLSGGTATMPKDLMPAMSVFMDGAAEYDHSIDWISGNGFFLDLDKNGSKDVEMIFNEDGTLTLKKNSANSVSNSIKITLSSEAKAQLDLWGEGVTYFNSVTFKMKSSGTVKITGLTLETPVEVVAGKSYTITPTFKPANTTQTGLTWKSSNTDVVTVNANGKIKGISQGKATITATSKSNGKISAKSSVRVLFTDATRDNVSSGMFTAIYWVADKKITGNKTDFGTKDSMTRGQFVRFLHRYAGSPKPSSTKNPFKDIDSSYTHYEAILWAVEQKLIDGYSDGTFKPNGTLTRNNVATILWKLAGSPKVSNPNNPFSDVDKSTAIAWGKSKGIFTGTKFQPKVNCLRGDFAVFLYRFDRAVN